eukprot:Phypoly_transcript_05337.p2 GENE.Phypoly_transcript_05337~~Phypoly_transcript_05337.p2  ORF type:complete len:201 (+),score=21.82 Phypoly_transcript_05337:204-806(+)
MKMECFASIPFALCFQMPYPLSRKERERRERREEQRKPRKCTIVQYMTRNLQNTHFWKNSYAGNHEKGMLRQHPLRPLLSNATYLDQEAVTINGLKIFGTKFFWPCPSGNPYYDQIPLDTDILVSHSPPKGYFDGGSGCPSLTEKVKLIKPLLHVFGHIHSAYGTGRGEGEFSKTIFVNAAMVVGEDRKLIDRSPIVVDL